ncbi:putative toxin-antitoxin system toxin component, PIN family [Pedobacter foliorum]|uniref:putative toxin-antitoxin system toxin component, PIN family n=1 Tax=Pedobacter foliorum TaxID=2739058 RepID=UPI00156402BD|nr:putative toxin-antitoxin system toxin component, PIN family [Pedobacter foliorum]
MGLLVVSASTLSELSEVLFRKKFDKYLDNEQRIGFINRIERDSKLFKVEETVFVCRDPKDNFNLGLSPAIP